MKDIAEELGLSVVTISKVLHNHPDISAKTRERVLKHVEARDYQPSMLGRSLVTGNSFLIGLVVPDLLHPFFAEVAKALSLAVRGSGYSLIISSSEEDPGLELQEMRQLLSRRIDAIVVASTATSGEAFQRMHRNNERVLLIDRKFPIEGGAFVGVDDVAAGRLATEHLIQVGCRNIAHIGGRENSTGLDRLEGYRQALLAANLPFSPKNVIHRTRVDTNSFGEGAAAARLLLSRKVQPDGIFCYNDPLAIGAMHVLLEAGVRIPEDIALVGCGNLHYDNSLLVPLSSIDQKSSEIGRVAGDIVLKMIANKEKNNGETVVLSPSLVVRASSRRGSAKATAKTAKAK
ncbi:LacI family DNA-binding transcriptional regulator [Granulicella aggregans]|nr:LacI family DNA-binding transcriptional regulator [Granulicella aggregans]